MTTTAPPRPARGSVKHLCPDARTIARHLQEFGSLTENQASDLYGIGRAAPRICELRRVPGWEGIRTEYFIHGGRRYGRWVLPRLESPTPEGD